MNWFRIIVRGSLLVALLSGTIIVMHSVWPQPPIYSFVVYKDEVETHEPHISKKMPGRVYRAPIIRPRTEFDV